MQSGPPAPETSFVGWLRTLPHYQDQVASYHFLPPRRALPAEGLPEAYASLAARLGLRPWRHQARALEAVAAGHDVVVATPTASGKSWAYRLPVLEALSRGGTALLTFPTKALAADQEASLREAADPFGLTDAVVRYDGDTPREERNALRRRAGGVITNPDMLHRAVLPYAERWASFLGRLEIVVVDELHAYRGVLGSHVGNVLRRLLRLAGAYGAEPRVVAASATIANPGGLLHDLTGREAVVVDEDAAPHGSREFVVWEPPTLARGDGRRRSANAEAADLAASFVRAGLRALFFCNSRLGAELVRRYTAAKLSEHERERLGSYRAGYTLEERRRIEARFRSGELGVLTATSALELGMDVGGVDAVVMVGYPGSAMSLWQRAGRAGRGGERSLALMIPGNDPLDEHYLRHPDTLVNGAVEAAVSDPFNVEIHPPHVVCAASERPLGPSDPFPAPWVHLDTVPGLVWRQGAWHARSRYPHRHVALRGEAGGRVRLRTLAGARLGEVDRGRAVRELHPGAVHLHGGEAYRVTRLDLEAGVAALVPHLEDWYTQVRSETHVEVLAREGARGLGAAAGARPEVAWGRVRVVETVHGYVRKRQRTDTVLEERALDVPEQSFDTQAAWFDATPLADAVAPRDLPSALHALEHTLIGLLPVFVLCERADVGGVSYPAYPGTGRPMVFVYDGAAGGVGYARAGAAAFPVWTRAARDLLAACPCRDGCPRCVLSPKCGNGNQYLDKRAAHALAQRLVGLYPDDAEPARAEVLE